MKQPGTAGSDFCGHLPKSNRERVFVRITGRDRLVARGGVQGRSYAIVEKPPFPSDARRAECVHERHTPMAAGRSAGLGAPGRDAVGRP